MQVNHQGDPKQKKQPTDFIRLFPKKDPMAQAYWYGNHTFIDKTSMNGCVRQSAAQVDLRPCDANAGLPAQTPRRWDPSPAVFFHETVTTCPRGAYGRG